MSYQNQQPAKRPKQWFFTGIAAMTLALTGLAGQTAHADTTANDAKTGSDQVTAESSLQQEQVTLTQPTSAATDQATSESNSATDTSSANPDQEHSSGSSDTGTTTKPTNDVQEASSDDTSTNSTVTTTATPDNATVTSATAPSISESTAPAIKHQSTTTQPAATSGIAPTSATLASPAAITTKAADESIDTWMPNKLLQQSVLKQLQALKNTDKTWNSVADITQADMLLLTSYNGTSTYIADDSDYSLEGLQYATNLTSIRLNNAFNNYPIYYYGNVRDLSPLAGLTKLTSVDIRNNQVSDITPLANLVNMTQLWSDFNYIADFSPLKDLSNLTDFQYGNQFVELPMTYVSATSKTASLPSIFYFKDGTQVTLKGANTVAKPVTLLIYSNGNYMYNYKYYPSGGNYAQDGQNGITYTNLVQQQQPGVNGQLDPNNIATDPGYRYYLVGAYSLNENNNPVQFTVVQPYTLVPDAQSATAHYVDEAGNELHASLTASGGLVGQQVTFPQFDIPGYTFKEIQGNAGSPVVTLSETEQTLSFVYTKAQAAAVTAKYQDSTGQTLHADVVLTGDLGAAYTTEQLTIPGYTYQKTQGNPSGTFSNTAQTVIYIYTKDDVPVTPVETGSITIHYLDDAGNVLSPAQLVSGQVGTAYSTTPLTIAGYQLSQSPANASGTFTAANQDVTYVYAATITDGGDGDKPVKPVIPPTKPTKPTNPGTSVVTPPTRPNQSGDSGLTTGSQAATGSAPVTTLAANQTQTTTANAPTVKAAALSTTVLPQTSEATTTHSWWGLGLLLTSSLSWLGFRRKRHQD